MNGCSRFGEDVSAHRDGELTGEARSAFDAHLPACDACRSALDLLEQLDRELDAMPRPEPPADFERRFWERIEQLEAPAQEVPRSGRVRAWLEALRSNVSAPTRVEWLVPAGAAAALAIALLVAFPRTQEPAPVDRDWALASDADGFELVLAEDPELFRDLELLEVWDGLEEI